MRISLSNKLNTNYSQNLPTFIPPALTPVVMSAQEFVPSANSTSSVSLAKPPTYIVQLQVLVQEANEATKATTANVNITFFIIYQCYFKCLLYSRFSTSPSICYLSFLCLC